MAQMIQTLVIFGASGDLCSRLLLPALGQLLTREPQRRVSLIGAASENWEQAKWSATVAASFATVDAQGPAVKALLSDTIYRQIDVTDSHQLRDLLALVHSTPALYFALPPAVTERACKAMEHVDLPTGTALVLEKPFGTNRRSAMLLNRQLAKLVPENQIHRVDHFLGLSTVLNLIGLRFANRIFDPVWSNEHIDRIDIVYDEELALEGRARYYDHAGALIDMIQSHLLQVMAVLALEPPSTLDAADLRDAKGLVLRATRLWKGSPVRSSRRARYTAGKIDGRAVPSYVREAGVDPKLETETLVEATFEINTWRWAGVPFTLRSGKALGQRRREIVVTFKQVPHLPGGLFGAEEPTKLRIFLGPDEMSLEVNINSPKDPYELQRACLSATFGEGQLLAYGEVLGGIFDADPSLSVRGDTAEECWRIVAPILRAWRAGRIPIDEYPAGSNGPKSWRAIG
jgi:glucose-6-phosphate 1-dehydrogenase